MIQGHNDYLRKNAEHSERMREIFNRYKQFWTAWSQKQDITLNGFTYKYVERSDAPRFDLSVSGSQVWSKTNELAPTPNFLNKIVNTETPFAAEANRCCSKYAPSLAQKGDTDPFDLIYTRDCLLALKSSHAQQRNVSLGLGIVFAVFILIAIALGALVSAVLGVIVGLIAFLVSVSAFGYWVYLTPR
jgi:hypothetical protein